ncbi:hypothetical protein [Dactylosporangium sp. CA-092794]|uniref:hypothetical protein n=1 Tax=Dactylosporangium sp. CA-092794 TaxID=3239929 RepID=UPI003D8D2589
MEAPTGRRTSWRLRAGSFVILAAIGSVLFAPPAFAGPEEGETSSAPVEVPPTTEVPTREPTTDAPTQAPPTTHAQIPPPTTHAPPPPPPPVHRFRMTVSTVSLGDEYWQGDGSAEMVISIKNAGDHVGRDAITGFYAFPSGAQATSAYGTGGCSVANGSLSFSCTLPEAALGQVVVKVNVDPGAWKIITTGLVTAAIGAQQRTAPIAFAFTRPPTPGIDLSASAPQLPPAAAAEDEPAQLSVRLRNTGGAKAAGAVEVVTPPGVDLVAFPPVCRSHRRVAADRDRCELGDIAGGRDVSAVFGLTVSAAARGELPLTGAVHGYLTPSGLATVETRYDFQLTAPPLTSADAPLPTSAPASPAPPPSIGTGLSLRRPGSGSDQLSSVPYLAAVIGLVTVLGVLAVLSLRRRLRDDDDALGPDEVEDVVLVPALGADMLPRLPTGPVAGSTFRDRDDE